MSNKSEFEVAKKKKDRSVKLKKFLSLLIVLALVFFLYSQRYELAGMGIGVYVKDSFAKMFDNKGFPVATEGTATVIKNVGKRAVLLSDNGFEVFNEAGNKVMSDRKTFTSPIAVTDDKKVLLFSQGGREMALYSGDMCIYEGKTENPIYNATLSKKGQIVYCTGEFGYQGSVRVLDKNFKEVFVWLSADAVITELAVNDDGNVLAAFGLGFQDGELCSCVHIFDLQKGQETGMYKFQGELILDSLFVSDNKIMAVTDKSVSVFDKEGDEINKFSFKGQPLNAYCFNDNKGIVISLGDFSSQRGTSLIVLDAGGKKILDTFIFEDARFIDLHRDDIVVFSEEKFVVLDPTLSFKKKGLMPDAVSAKVVGDYVLYSTEQSLERIHL